MRLGLIYMKHDSFIFFCCAYIDSKYLKNLFFQVSI